MMTQRRHRPALLLATTILAGVSLLATAQLVTLRHQKPIGRAGNLAVTAAANEPVSRLIVKFRQTAGEKIAPLAAEQVHEKLRALGSRSSAMQRSSAGPVDLVYVKSIAPQTHVALTTRPLERTEMTAMVKQMAADAEVEYAEIDEKMYPLFLPNDPEFVAKQWNLKNPVTDGELGGANLTAAWDRVTTLSAPVNGTGVVVAVVDGGYRPHSDLAANILQGYDFISPDSAGVFTTANDGDGRDSNPQDPGDWVTSATTVTGCPIENSSWHGTHVAGVVGALGNNSIGITGAAFGAKILPVRVLGVCGGFTSDIAAGMRWAAGLAVSGVPANTNVAKVINLSLGSTGTCLNTFQSAVNDVRSAPGGGSVVIAATGNDGTSTIGQPANCNGVIAVTAHTRLGDSADYADVGVGTSLSAPGGGYGFQVKGDGSSIYSLANTGTTTPGADSYAFKIGTSSATPHVSAVAALLYQVKPGLTPDNVLSYLVNSVRPFPANSYCFNNTECGAGMLDADKAVALALAANAPVTTATSSPANPVSRNATVTLTATAAAASGASITSTQWTQLSGTSVNITNSNALVTTVQLASTLSNYVFKFEATDNMSRKTESRVTVQVANSAPALATIASQTVGLGDALSFKATATDLDGDTVTYSASGLPTGATFSSTTGVFNWQVARPAGTYQVTITPKDAVSAGASATVNVTVSAPASSGGGAPGWLDLLALAALALAGAALRLRPSAEKNEP